MQPRMSNQKGDPDNQDMLNAFDHPGAARQSSG